MAGSYKQSGKLTMPLLVLLAVCLFCRGAEAQYGGGTGTAEDPYLIYTAEQMNAIGEKRSDWDKHFKLMADIDLSAYTGTDFNIIGYYVTFYDNKPFTGVFDENGHTISNFSYTSTDTDDIGLFRYVGGETADIKDLGLIDPNVDAGTGDRVGSLVGYLSRGNVTGYYVEGGSVSGNERVGGLVGYNYRGTIIDCSATSSVSGTTAIGGLVGYNRDTISNCYSSGEVTGYSYVGGLFGYNRDTITNSYATGIVTGDRYVGGFVGDNLVGRITDSFWDLEASGQSLGVGLGSDDGISGKTTAEMQSASTFLDAGWDFVDESENGTEDNWWILEDQDYPGLTWELIEDDSIVLTDNWLTGISN